MNEQELQQAFIQFLAQKLGVSTQEELESAIQQLGEEGLKQAYAEFMQVLQQQQIQSAKQGSKLKYLKKLRGSKKDCKECGGVFDKGGKAPEGNKKSEEQYIKERLNTPKINPQFHRGILTYEEGPVQVVENFNTRQGFQRLIQDGDTTLFFPGNTIITNTPGSDRYDFERHNKFFDKSWNKRNPVYPAKQSGGNITNQEIINGASTYEDGKKQVVQRGINDIISRSISGQDTTITTPMGRTFTNVNGPDRAKFEFYNNNFDKFWSQRQQNKNSK